MSLHYLRCQHCEGGVDMDTGRPCEHCGGDGGVWLLISHDGGIRITIHRERPDPRDDVGDG